MAVKRLTVSQEIAEGWPGFWEYNCKIYHSLRQARMVRAAANGDYNYEEDNYDD